MNQFQNNSSIFVPNLTIISDYLDAVHVIFQYCQVFEKQATFTLKLKWQIMALNEIIIHFVLGFIASIIGAMPFGLVNLSVVDSTLNKSERAAFLVSVGATIIEIVFVLLAIFLGSRLADYMEDNLWIEFFILMVLLTAGISFLLRKKTSSKKKTIVLSGFLKGMLLNLLSVQVLLYWFVAIAYLQTSNRIVFTSECIAAFAVAAGLGKMLTLLFYRLMAKKIKSRSGVIAHRINVIIGTIMIGLAVFQLVKILFF